MFTSTKINAAVEKRIRGVSYRENPYITLDDLRYVQILYWDLNGESREGELVVNRVIAPDTAAIFCELYRMKYPLAEVALVDKYDADDGRSMAANNTSAFNYRTIDGEDTLSLHALGLAIDINPGFNPYIRGDRIEPAGGEAYAERDPEKCRGRYRAYMIRRDDPKYPVYRLFRRYGFEWGGDWTHCKDYHHFEKSSLRSRNKFSVENG